MTPMVYVNGLCLTVLPHGTGTQAQAIAIDNARGVLYVTGFTYGGSERNTEGMAIVIPIFFIEI